MTIKEEVIIGFQSSTGKSYDMIKGVTVYVSRNFNMLSEITTGKEV